MISLICISIIGLFFAIHIIGGLIVYIKDGAGDTGWD